ncbi:hypothetical protein PHLGIDRAFT_16746 [Phlebiopsis gigantea 11061_1 CR5-6]|uniref:Uncharacterized protein n=1 Tax=Phlebiopsis gigantea (strain 11061_1 CR5-6) TaxID=745531 RepID=A0A0C3PB53_PHLG1|nr:hypothetical protein PHLGIDRAFT_16746 [Phlebiopsis gigantea 11061_1 CR5-6]
MFPVPSEPASGRSQGVKHPAENHSKEGPVKRSRPTRQQLEVENRNLATRLAILMSQQRSPWLDHTDGLLEQQTTPACAKFSLLSLSPMVLLRTLEQPANDLASSNDVDPPTAKSEWSDRQDGNLSAAEDHDFGNTLLEDEMDNATLNKLLGLPTGCSHMEHYTCNTSPFGDSRLTSSLYLERAFLSQFTHSKVKYELQIVESLGHKLPFIAPTALVDAFNYFDRVGYRSLSPSLSCANSTENVASFRAAINVLHNYADASHVWRNAAFSYDSPSACQKGCRQYLSWEKITTQTMHHVRSMLLAWFKISTDFKGAVLLEDAKAYIALLTSKKPVQTINAFAPKFNHDDVDDVGPLPEGETRTKVVQTQLLFLRKALAVAENSVLPHPSPAQQQLFLNLDFYLSLRKLAPSRRCVNSLQGPGIDLSFGATNAGLFSLLIFRNISFNTEALRRVPDDVRQTQFQSLVEFKVYADHLEQLFLEEDKDFFCNR